MIDLLKAFLSHRLTSRKFLVAVGAYVIVLLDGLGVAHFSPEVMVTATGVLAAYIAAEGLVDVRRSGGP